MTVVSDHSFNNISVWDVIQHTRTFDVLYAIIILRVENFACHGFESWTSSFQYKRGKQCAPRQAGDPGNFSPVFFILFFHLVYFTNDLLQYNK